MSVRWFLACIAVWTTALCLWKIVLNPFFLFTGAGICFCIAGFCFFRQFRATSKVTYCGWFFFCLALGLFVSAVYSTRLLQVQTFVQNTKADSFFGTIVSIPKQNAFDDWQFDVRIRGACEDVDSFCFDAPKQVVARVTTDSISSTIEKGAKVSIKGKIQLPKQVPLGKHTTTFADYLLTKNVGAVINNAKIMHTLSAGGVHAFRNIIRQSFWDAFQKNVTAPYNTIVAGITYGEAIQQLSSFENMFRGAGLSHIMVLSGSNVTLMLSLLLPLLVYLPSRWFVWVGRFAVLLSFLFFLGTDPPLVRAVIMTAGAFIIKEWGNPSQAFRLLCITALIMASLHPVILLYDVSFHLSFLATLGMVCASDYFTRLFWWAPTRWKIQETLVLTTAVSVFVYPYVAYQFGTFAVWGIFANLFVVPLVPMVMGAGWLMIATAYTVPFFAKIIGVFITACAWYIVYVAQIVQQLPFASASFQLSFISMCALYALLLLLFRRSIA